MKEEKYWRESNEMELYKLSGLWSISKVLPSLRLIRLKYCEIPKRKCFHFSLCLSLSTSVPFAVPFFRQIFLFAQLPAPQETTALAMTHAVSAIPPCWCRLKSAPAPASVPASNHHHLLCVPLTLSGLVHRKYVHRRKWYINLTLFTSSPACQHSW